MRHKLYDMIVAKAANMDLVVFIKSKGGWGLACSHPNFHPNNNYFLCLPQHKEAVLGSLNGGVALYESPREKGEHALGRAEWKKDDWYMQDDCKSRIKPKKEKRWIVYRNRSVYGEYMSPEDINEDFKRTGQVIEIEVEV